MTEVLPGRTQVKLILFLVLTSWWVINENEIYVAWQQVDGPEGIWFAKSTDYGETFTDSMIWEGWERRGITALCMDENENLHLAL